MRKTPYPDLPRTVLLLLTTLVVGAALLSVTMKLFPDWPRIAQMALPTDVALALVVAYAVRRTGRPWRDALALHPLDPRAIGPLLLVLVGSVTVFSELYVVIQRIAPVPDEFERLLRDLLELSGMADIFATLMVAVVVAPILEEALFRGIILQGLMRSRGPYSASLWTAAFFALFHLYNPWQILPTFFLGLILAWLVLTTRTLVAAIALHALFNGVSLALFGVPIESTSPSEEALPWVVGAIVLVLLLGSFALLYGMVSLERQTGGGWFVRPLGNGEPEPPEGEEPDYAAEPATETPGGGPFTARG